MEKKAQGTGEELLMKVLHELLEEVKENGGTFSDEQLKALETLFPQHLLAALDLAERGAVTQYTCSSPHGDKTLYLVQGSSGQQYLCFSSSSYCSCPSFTYSVLVRKEMLLCKHQLALHLAHAMQAQGMCRHVHVSGEEWAKMAALDTPILTLAPHTVTQKD